MKSFKIIVLLCLLSFCFSGLIESQGRTPYLKKTGNVTQLIVDDKPYLALGGELSNNAATNLDYLRALWPGLKERNLNTVLVAISWAQFEPSEGKYDYTIVDGVLKQARENNMRLVLLWFGSWKNTWSSYVPDWIKKDFSKYPRVQLRDGSGTERLTPLSEVNQNADAKAFAAFMKHLKEVDSQDCTVIMIQVQNEVGVIPDARDHSPMANRAYNGQVPRELMDYLVKNRETIAPELRTIWHAAGFKNSGTWEEVFGSGLPTHDLFMAWYYAKYIGKVAEAGKAEYNIPMFANAALIRTNYAPGQFNSGGPLPHSADIWRAGGPQIDFIAPDIYFGFKEWSDKYVRNGNPLFIPEMSRGANGASYVYYAIGHNNAIGVSPFGIDRSGGPNDPLGRSYNILSQLSPLILEHQTKGNVAGVVLESITPSQKITLGGYMLNIQGGNTQGQIQSGTISAAPDPHGIFIASGPDEFYMAGSGLTITFSPLTDGPPIVGLATVEEGKFMDGKWVPGRRLAGDDTGQGNNVSLSRTTDILRVTVYRYR